MNIFLDLFLTFMKIGGFTFGGGYAMLSLIDHECVEKKQWITSDELMDITVIAESTPGPIAINCATYTGYKKAGIKGAISATLGMILPSFAILLIISTFLEDLLQYPFIANALKGIRLAVAYLILRAAVKMIQKMRKKSRHSKISLGFVLVFFAITLTLNILHISFSSLYLILISGICGFCIFRLMDRKEATK